jgi:hypothetical protein
MVIKKSDSMLMKVIHYFLIAITFGKNKRFMTDYVTTIGRTIYVPASWDSASEDRKSIVLLHERVHIEQFEREGIWFALKYLFWPLPTIRAKARIKYECEAFAKEIVHEYKIYLTPVFSGRFDQVVEELSGPGYFWACTDKGYIRKVLTFCILRELRRLRSGV